MVGGDTMTAPTTTTLERLATEATAAGIDPVTALAEKVEVTAHGDGWIVAGDVHLSLGVTGWHSSPSALIGGA